MKDDVKRNADIMRATSNVLAIIEPFAPEDRLRIIVTSLVMAGCDEVLMTKIPSVGKVLSDLKEKRF